MSLFCWESQHRLSRIRFGTLRLMAIENNMVLLVIRPWLISDDSSESILFWSGIALHYLTHPIIFNQIMCFSFVTNRNFGSSRFRFGTLPLRAIEGHRSLEGLAAFSVRYVFLLQIFVCVTLCNRYVIFLGLKFIFLYVRINVRMSLLISCLSLTVFWLEMSFSTYLFIFEKRNFYGTYVCIAMYQSYLIFQA